MVNDTPKPALPRHWEKRILAAYHLIMGATWDSAGRAVGRSRRTIGNWIADHELWQQARQEAEERWLYDLKDAARQAVYQQVKGGDGNLGFTILERLDEHLKPSKSPLIETHTHVHLEPVRDRLRQKLATMAQRHGASNGHHATPQEVYNAQENR